MMHDLGVCMVGILNTKANDFRRSTSRDDFSALEIQ